MKWIRRLFVILNYVLLKRVLAYFAWLSVMDYLDTHSNVRDAIAWEVDGNLIKYQDWDSNPNTLDFKQTLEKMFTSIASGENVSFSFSQKIDPKTGKPMIAPVLQASYMTLTDASEIYLAHIAFSLWINLIEEVNWSLDQYSTEYLELLLNGQCFFTEGTHANANWSKIYIVNPNNGQVTPTDPVKAYQFLKPLIKGTQRETILALSRWVRDHLRHGPLSICTPQVAPTYYQYDGDPPLEKIFLPTVNVEDAGTIALGPRYWSWCGCHSASGLLVWLMRIINIPCVAPYTFTADYPSSAAHRGIDFPSETLFSEHTDNFFAWSFLLDPAIEPEKIYRAGNDYLPWKNKFTAQPLPGENRTDYYMQGLGMIALGQPTCEVVQMYWEQLLYPLNYIFVPYLHNKFNFTDADSANLMNQYKDSLETTINNFKQQYQQQISQELNKPENSNKSEDEVAYDLFVKTYEAWKSAR